MFRVGKKQPKILAVVIWIFKPSIYLLHVQINIGNATEISLKQPPTAFIYLRQQQKK